MEQTVSESRIRSTFDRIQQHDENTRAAIIFKSKGYSNAWIAAKLGLSEGTVRNYLKSQE